MATKLASLSRLLVNTQLGNFKKVNIAHRQWLTQAPKYSLATRNFSTEDEATKSNFEGLKISDSAIKRLKEVCTDGSFLRISVEGGGCSGFQYKFDFDTTLLEDDLQFGTDDAKVVIDTTSLEYVDGATIDYTVELIRAGFRIQSNPKAEGGCSCGSSFSIKID